MYLHEAVATEHRRCNIIDYDVRLRRQIELAEINHVLADRQALKQARTAARCSAPMLGPASARQLTAPLSGCAAQNARSRPISRAL